MSTTTIALILIIIMSCLTTNYEKTKKKIKKEKLTATVMNIEEDKVSLQDKNNIIYTFKKDMNVLLGEKVSLDYIGTIDRNRNLQKGRIKSYTTTSIKYDENGIPTTWLDDGIFSQFYILAYDKLKELSLDEKISQLLLVKYPDEEGIEKLKEKQFGGYIFYEKDFKNKSKNEVIKMMNDLQNTAKIPILTAVDEEGGEVVRVSSNENLVKEKFKSPQELYQDGGMDKITIDTIDKSKILKDLGLNLNLAPVVDVSTSPSDYIYKRTIGENTEITSEYAKTVIEASKDTGVSYTLKHFPGYGNNQDTHQSSVEDEREYESILKNDIPPFKAGIDAKAEAVLVNHNIVKNIDSENPASLSPSVHNILRNELKFTGIIMTDDLSMKATSSIENSVVKALLAGNDLIITDDYDEAIKEIKKALENKTIGEDLINKLAFRVLAWKYYKGLMFEVHK